MGIVMLVMGGNHIRGIDFNGVVETTGAYLLRTPRLEEQQTYGHKVAGKSRAKGYLTGSRK